MPKGKERREERSRGDLSLENMKIIRWRKQMNNESDKVNVWGKKNQSPIRQEKEKREPSMR